ncbi:MAG: peroxiredoxin family protein [Polymorphobacter sp.]|uniref:peroxiredoxin family protein n=1 Tax=Polymorphobacter sp. TaxID=1909290 RepID=UPI003A8B5787
MMQILMMAVMLLAAPALAAIPDAGDRAPPLVATDLTGKARTISSVAGPKGTVLVFFRSASWCPYCKAQLIDLNTNAAETLKARGYALVGLSYDAPDVLAKFAAERGVKWTLLSDPQSKVIDGWDLRDPQYGPGSRAEGVPRPAIFVIAPDGTIKARLMEESYRDRPQIEAVLAAAP